MSLNTNKQNELAKRREVENRLFGLGFSLQDVGTAMGLDQSSVKNDYDKLGGKDKFPTPETSLAERRDKAYRSALKMYAKLNGVNAEILQMDEGIYCGLTSALRNYLDIRYLQGMACGIEGTLKSLIVPADPPKYQPYRRLLRAVFGLWGWPGGLDVFSQYFRYLTIPDVIPPSRGVIWSEMAKWAVAEYRDHFTAPLTEHVVGAVAEALQTLTPRQEKIIRLRFGLDDGKQMTLGEIAAYYGYDYTGERIRQIEAKALRLLRHPSRSRSLRVFVMTPEENIANYVDGLFPPPPPPPLKDDPKILKTTQAFINLSVDELELSVRTYNCLKNANIQTVVELVQKTKPELFQIKSFGLRSFEELKNLLEQNNLYFGMRISPKGKLIYPKNYEVETRLEGEEEV